jgi:hypothetical protein
MEKFIELECYKLFEMTVLWLDVGCFDHAVSLHCYVQHPFPSIAFPNLHASFSFHSPNISSVSSLFPSNLSLHFTPMLYLHFANTVRLQETALQSLW